MNDPVFYAPPLPTAQPAPAAPQRKESALRSFVAVALIAAVLGSLGTVGLVAFVGVGSAGVAGSSAAPGFPSVVVAADIGSSDLASTVSKAKESVVTITAQGIDTGFSALDIPATGVGSGIVITADGLILTNNHVVEGANSLTVTTEEGADIDATVVATDPAKDIAIIRTGSGGLAPAKLGDSGQLKVGQTVLAIGSSLGEYTESVTQGIISALGRSITVSDETTGAQKDLAGLIQTDAAINPGNSGGPLIDTAGEVMGMNTALTRGSEGINFAIPIDAARELISKASTPSS
jgi:S1-C subfamily serine protease